MRLIHNTTFISYIIEENKLSCFSSKDYSILEGNIIESKYIKELIIIDNYNNFNRVSILEATDEEKLIIDDRIKKELEYEEYINSFLGYKYKVTSHISIIEELNPYYFLYKIGIVEKNPTKTIYDSSNNLTHIVSFWNELKQPFYDILFDETILATDGTKMFILETNPTIKDEASDTITT